VEFAGWTLHCVPQFCDGSAIHQLKFLMTPDFEDQNTLRGLDQAVKLKGLAA